MIDEIEPLILKEIQKEDKIDLQVFMDICDLFILLPLRKKQIKNGSKEIYQIMSCNKLDSFTSNHPDVGTHLNKMLELFWSKLE
jgi:hypothetical protein